jgi:hypothetical protein
MADSLSGNTKPASGEWLAESPCDLLSVLATMKHYTLYLDRRCALLVAQRTCRPFERADDIATCFDEIDRELKNVLRRRYSLLVDTRSGPLRNDPDFEAALSLHRGKLLMGFAKNAALVSTAAGVLQIQRFARIDGRRVFATHEPPAAFEYLGVPYHRV